MQIVDPISNKLRDSEDISFVEKIFGLKAAGKRWELIDTVVEHWRRHNPKKYRSFLIEMDTKRGTRLNATGSNKTKTMRSLADIPEDIIYRLRKIYSPEELQMDKEFFTEMYKRYPFMRVAEKL